jgi:uncharacterized membrane protein YoaK (UPF0700 family)
MFRTHPKWIVIGGCILAFLSAATNAGFLIHLGTSVSHLTGDVSKVAVDVVRGERSMESEAWTLVVAAMSFVGGAMAAGFFIHHPGLDLDRPYGRSVSCIGLCLLGAHFAMESMPSLAVGLAGFAFGFQNALATHYRGMVLRTTHLTGLLTDFGVNLGMRIKGHEIAVWKLIVPGSLILSFFIGSAVGACMVLWWRLPFALLLSMAYLFGGLAWTAFKHLVIKKGYFASP